MSLRTRTLWGLCAVTLWFGLVAPHVHDRIQRSTLEGPKPFSLQNLRDKLAADTGSPDEGVVASMTELAALQRAEEVRVSAMWSLFDPQTLQQARTLVHQLPPPKHAVDPRFFEPLVPELIRRTSEGYGVGRAPLPTDVAPQSDTERDDLLRVMLSAAHHRLMDEEQAASLLQGAHELLELQMDRMALESDIRDAIELVP